MRHVRQNLSLVSWGIGWCLLLSFGAAGEASSVEADEISHIQLGQCELPVDPLVERDELWLLACAKARYGWEQLFVGAAPDENGQVRYASGYLGLHLNRFLSLHARGLVRHYLPSTDQTVGSREERPEIMIAQVGNPAFHKFRLLAGRIQMPFGIDFSPVMESYQLLEQRTFWASLPHGVQFIYDNLRDVVVETAVATNEYSRESEIRGVTRTAISARSSFDFPALDGSRLIFSGYWQDIGPQRVGFGFVTVSHRNDVTQFEWVRIRHDKDEEGAFSDQLFRLGYLSQWRNRTRFALQYDDLWKQRRSFIFGYDMLVHDNLTVRSGLSFVKQLSAPEDHRYVFSMGLEAHL